jgi:hypothetical protein
LREQRIVRAQDAGAPSPLRANGAADLLLGFRIDAQAIGPYDAGERSHISANAHSRAMPAISAPRRSFSHITEWIS